MENSSARLMYIDEDPARQRRSDIQREADFFGSMDGASKFVKGDAIMSLVTTFINLIGGILWRGRWRTPAPA